MNVLCLFAFLVILTESALVSDLTKSDLIKTLQFSPGGVDFYERFLRENKPMLVKDAALHWPAIKLWSNVDYFLNKFTDKESQIQQDNVPVVNLINEKKEINVSILETILSKDIHLPFFIQCEEFLKNIMDVNLILNRPSSNHIQFNLEEVLILPFSSMVSLHIFGRNNSQSGADLRNVGMSDVNLLFNVPSQMIKLNPGDVIYIPKYSWFHLKSETPGQLLDYITYRFDVFPFNVDNSLKYIEMYENYKEGLSETPETISCSNNKYSVQDVLKIDMDDDQKYMHLRIPRKNERPEDVTLASGYKMPVLGLGTALLNESTYDAVKYALGVGYRLFDLAYGYPNSEVGFGKAFIDTQVKREDVFVVTKLHPKFLGYEETLEAIDKSLERLNMSYIDLYLIHSIDCDDFLLKCEKGEPRGTWKESWRAMEKAKQNGKIRSLGFSNIYGETIFELLKWSEEPVSVIQNWFDPLNQDEDTRKICSKHNIRYMGYSTLGSRWQFAGLGYNPILESDTISRIAGHYDYVISHVVLRWAIHLNVTVIPRSANPKHIKQNLRSLDIKLFPTDIEELNQMEKTLKDMMELEDI